MSTPAFGIAPLWAVQEVPTTSGCLCRHSTHGAPMARVPQPTGSGSTSGTGLRTSSVGSTHWPTGELMARPPLPVGSYGKITSWQDGPIWLARAKFRDFDGVARPVKRSAKTRTAAERALRAALVERQTPAKRAEVTP